MLHGTKVPATAVSTPTPATAGESAEAATTKDQDARTKRHTTIAVVLSVLAAAALAFAGALVYQRRKKCNRGQLFGPATQPYGANQGGGGGQPNYANPVYAHHPNNPAVDGPAYAEVADENSNDDEAPYEAPSQEQVAVYDDGGALGAARQCIQTTSTGRCAKMAAAGGERCSMHVCSKTGCTNSKSSKVKFCRAHATAQSKQPSTHLGFGGYCGDDGLDAEDVSNV